MDFVDPTNPEQTPTGSTITIFTDGGCVGNGSKDTSKTKAVWAFIVYDGQTEVARSSGYLRQGEYGDEVPTNNRAEYMALLRAFEWIKENGGDSFSRRVTVWTDSNLACQTINLWYEGWERRGTLHKIKNLTLVKELIAAYRSVPTKVKHCKSHQSYPTDPHDQFIWLGNNEADSLCRKLLES
jgi:ribonuclease HI